MKLEIPIVEPKPTLTVQKFLEGVARDIESIDARYSSVYQILGDAMKGAIKWAPAAVMNKQAPPLQDIYTLAVQLLTVCYATKRNLGDN